jgi:hypothetical protein
LFTGRCQQDLPLDAGEGFDQQRYLVQKEQTWLFDRNWQSPEPRWRWTAKRVTGMAGSAQGLDRARRKWRDGALWMLRDNRICRWDVDQRLWVQKADPGLEFMDFDVDLTGRILLVCTADPRTRSYRALLEAVEDGGTTVLARYPDPGSPAWGRKVSPVAAASLQAGYESVQIQEYLVLFNPLARRLLVFRPLEDRIQEVKLGLPTRSYQDLVEPGPMDDLCWQVLPKGPGEAWLVMARAPAEGPRALTALPVDLVDGTVGTAQPMPGLHLPLFPDPQGHLVGLEEVMGDFAAGPRATP